MYLSILHIFPHQLENHPVQQYFLFDLFSKTTDARSKN